jgi:hypothetical protein
VVLRLTASDTPEGRRKLRLAQFMASRQVPTEVLSRSPAESAEAQPTNVHAPSNGHGNGHTPALVEKSDTIAADEPAPVAPPVHEPAPKVEPTPPTPEGEPPPC